MHTAQLIIIGDEILIGRTQDTNSHYLARELHRLGIQVQRVRVVPDGLPVIKSSISEALRDDTLVIMTGGLGPTKDDVTKTALLEHFGGELVLHDETHARILQYYQNIGREPNPLTLQMAQVPSTCTPLLNPAGAAPGMVFVTENGRQLYSLPGIPREMRGIYEAHIRKELEALTPDSFIHSHTFRLVGMPESKLSQLLDGVESKLPKAFALAYNPSGSLLDLRLRVQGAERKRERLMADFQMISADIEHIIQPNHYADGEDSLAWVILQILRKRDQSLATVESITGGNVAAAFVAEAGASDVFSGGMVTYTQAAKMKSLGVQAATLDTFTAVSPETALEMAHGARKHFGTNYAVSTTGYAGPGGGSDGTPIGTVFIAVVGLDTEQVREYHFGRSRKDNIERATVTALHQLWRVVMKEDLNA